MATARRDVPASTGSVSETKPGAGEDLASALGRHPSWSIARSENGFAAAASGGSVEMVVGDDLRILPTSRVGLAETIVDSALDCIVVMDARGRVVEFNPEAQRTFGYTREQALERRVSDLMPREVAAAHRRGLKRHLATGVSRILDRPIETIARRADGSLFPVELRVTRIPGREPPLFVGFLRDLTEHKRTEEVLKETAVRLEAVVENVPDMIYHYRFRPEPGYEYVSPVAAEMFGYAPDEFYADPHLWKRLVHPEDLPGLIRAMALNPASLFLTIRCVRKDGGVIHCHLGRRLLVDDQGQPLGSVGVIRDDTELFQMHRRLRRSNHRLRKVLGERVHLMRRLVAAHEDERRRIATAIHDDSIQAVAALAMRISAMRRQAAQTEDLGKAMEGVERNASEAVSRLRRLMFELHPTTLDRAGLAATVRAHIDQLPREEEAKVRLEDGLAAEPSQPVRLAMYRVIQEALTNARRHARAANVTVTLSDSQDEVVARIRDDGVGFAIDEIASPVGHLGLSAMREHVEAVKGVLSVESRPGAGTTVEARIPKRARLTDDDF